MRPSRPVLRFSPTAWAKLLHLRDSGETEIGCFGIAFKGDLLFVEDVRLVRQTCTWTHVAFDDDAVADFFDAQVDAGRRPEEFARIWVHTHPGNSAEPSSTDEATFVRVFGGSNWAVMFILARDGQTYARLRLNVGPGADIQLPIEIDYSRQFASSAFDQWQEEYRANVRVPPPEPTKNVAAKEKKLLTDDEQQFLDDWWRDSWSEYVMDFEYPRQDYETYGYIRDF
jgi:proteasome lid subunit RPN8/RPN11